MSDYPMLISNKLHSFRNFASQICKKLSELVDVKYWKELKKILLRNNKNEVFKRAIEPI